MLAERVAQRGAAGRQVTGEERGGLVEAHPVGVRGLPDRGVQGDGQLGDRGPGARVVGERAEDERGPLGVAQHGGQRGHGVRVGGGADDQAARGRAARTSSAGSAQSLIGTITTAGPRWMVASCSARAIAPGTSPARAGSSTLTG